MASRKEVQWIEALIAILIVSMVFALALPNLFLITSAASAPQGVPGLGGGGLHSTDAQCPNLSKEMFAESAHVNVQKAMNLARPLLGSGDTFLSNSNSWEVGAACSFTWVSVNLAYNVPGQEMVISVDPSLSKVLAVNYYPTTYGSTPIKQNIWAGWEYNPGSALAQSSADWYVPSASQGDVSCNFNHCDMEVWVGLSTQAGGNPGLAQTGTDSGLYCDYIGCSYYYWTFYNFYTNGQQNVYCPSGSHDNISPNNEMYAQVSTADGNGNPTEYYTIYLHDDTNGVTCTGSQPSGWPDTYAYYAQYIVERPGDTLAKFSTVSFDPASYCTNSHNSCTLVGSGGQEYQLWQNQEDAYANTLSAVTSMRSIFQASSIEPLANILH